jgi:hypothetical protein
MLMPLTFEQDHRLSAPTVKMILSSVYPILKHKMTMKFLIGKVSGKKS